MTLVDVPRGTRVDFGFTKVRSCCACRSTRAWAEVALILRQAQDERVFEGERVFVFGRGRY